MPVVSKSTYVVSNVPHRDIHPHQPPCTTTHCVATPKVPAPPVMVQEPTRVMSIVSKSTRAPSAIASSFENANERVSDPSTATDTTTRRVGTHGAPAPHRMVLDTTCYLSIVPLPPNVDPHMPSEQTIFMELESIWERHGVAKEHRLQITESVLECVLKYIHAQRTVCFDMLMTFRETADRAAARYAAPQQNTLCSLHHPPPYMTLCCVSTHQEPAPPIVVLESTRNVSTASYSPRNMSNRAENRRSGLRPLFLTPTDHSMVCPPQQVLETQQAVADRVSKAPLSPPSPPSTPERTDRRPGTLRPLFLRPRNHSLVSRSPPLPDTTCSCVPKPQTLTPPRLVQESTPATSSLVLPMGDTNDRVSDPSTAADTTTRHVSIHQVLVPPIVVPESTRVASSVPKTTRVVPTIMLMESKSSTLVRIEDHDIGDLLDPLWETHGVEKIRRRIEIEKRGRACADMYCTDFAKEPVTTEAYNRMVYAVVNRIAERYSTRKKRSRASSRTSPHPSEFTDEPEQNTKCSVSIPHPKQVTNLPETDTEVSSCSKPPSLSQPASDLTDVSVRKGEGAVAKASHSFFGSQEVSTSITHHDLAFRDLSPSPASETKQGDAYIGITDRVIDPPPPDTTTSCDPSPQNQLALVLRQSGVLSSTILLDQVETSLVLTKNSYPRVKDPYHLCCQ